MDSQLCLGLFLLALPVAILLAAIYFVSRRRRLRATQARAAQAEALAAYRQRLAGLSALTLTDSPDGRWGFRLNLSADPKARKAELRTLAAAVRALRTEADHAITAIYHAHWYADDAPARRKALVAAARAPLLQPHEQAREFMDALLSEIAIAQANDAQAPS